MRFTLSKALLALATTVGALFVTASPGFARQGTWTAGANFPTVNVRGAGAWFAPNSRFYVMGGRVSDTAGSDLLSPSEYDPSTNIWTTKTAVFASNQVNNMVVGVLNDAGTDYIYCVGGSAAGAATSTPDVRRYDPIADVISPVASDPFPAPVNTLGGGAAVLGNKLYVVGGFTIGVGMTTQIWEFDPAAAAGTRWTLKTAVLPVAVGYVPTARIGSLIYMAGGATFAGGILSDSNTSSVYDPALDTITGIALTPRATGETRAVNQGGALWVLGGGRVAPNPSNQVDAYSPGGNTWSLAPAFVTARRNIAADIDPATGNIYMVGGYDATALGTNNMEIFRNCALPTSYCTAKTNSVGCVPAIGSSGTASATAGSGFLVNATNMVNNKSCLLFYGVTGQAATPFQAGTLCVAAPIKRTPGTVTGGNPPPNDCSGAPSIDMNLFAVGGGGGTPLPALTIAGTVVNCQWWGRDPGFVAPDNTQLSNGLEYMVCP